MIKQCNNINEFYEVYLRDMHTSFEFDNEPYFIDMDYCIKSNNDLIIFKKNSIKNYPISLIIDGNILKDNLFSIKKNIDWLERKIDDNYLNLKDINYAYYKNNEVYFITN